MNFNVPAIEEYEKLIPVARQIYEHTSRLSWQMLLPLFLVSIAMSYTSDLGVSGAILIRVKRLILVALLLVAFPTVAEFSQIVGVEIARSIDDMKGIDQVLNAASQRADKYSFDLKGLLTLGSQLFIGTLVFASFLLLVVARFFLLAFQHFYWFLLVAIGPFLILGTLFEASSGITRGLFKTMFQISSWPIIWSVLSAFLKALPFADVYAAEGSFVTIITLNLIITIALLFSPLLVSQLSDGVSLTVGDTLKKGVLKAFATTSPASFIAANGTATIPNFKKNR